MRTYSCGEGGIFVNAYLVETRAGVVAVDATLTESDSKAFRKEMEALGKPLQAVLITHPHPDHVAGITNLVAADETKIIATQAVIDLMRKLEEPKRKFPRGAWLLRVDFGERRSPRWARRQVHAPAPLLGGLDAWAVAGYP